MISLQKSGCVKCIIGDDVNNPIRQLYSSVTGQPLNHLGMPSLSELGMLPKGSICWQKLSKISSQDYIECSPIATENTNFCRCSN